MMKTAGVSRARCALPVTGSPALKALTSPRLIAAAAGQIVINNLDFETLANSRYPDSYLVS
ncbi:hypothetical protein H4F47_14680 [Pectobacterium brasiliense]|uniref:hypothetical protein n=1 Tax=Pectobacterium brasiliense TaxID=180957 RepID=UPI0019699932|nr:hypothetical protein [Pectobacterium brasiliense]MBN3044159.1 hypothetical protein [Pectobacterium brasiliense]MDY4324186.1 hypothetical protein [Pectobacterium brasiliense]